MKYDSIKISKELASTALGNAYYGNALYVAMDIPCLDDIDKNCLKRWLDGSNTAIDGFQLQTIANKINQGKA